MSRLKDYYLGRMYQPSTAWATKSFPALYESINGEWFGFPISELEIVTTAIEFGINEDVALSQFTLI